ncbi:Transcription antitermination protein NusB (NusB) (PDB:1EY1) (PUBMED:21652641) [Commensalibacter communis]|uniref:transcription antitermination factor NusB n=1 Tax=Commensalibacter communis TaxID=2972786 RepID=UPI0022FF4EAF|nr:transcription antitermination factor NusB [Commensalibacter communis]CAI3924080.1 Transcription antitermination protein NusB (NusB) (PDB:1EY1) (PUBMED:21652641) [Commensalibacter communis]CAI3935070.1 Transcription antitermination protein NusB (NusB) (PDB:1EY1) (PUBMED:21652641) [Commensalibacter communis]
MNTQTVKRPRTLTRIAAVQALFQWEQGTVKAANLIIEQFLLYRIDPQCNEEIYNDGKAYIPNINLFKNIIEQFIHQSSEIDIILTKSLPKDWPLHRLDPIIRAISRAAIAELLNDVNDPPTKVIINEYIDVTRAFCDGEEASLINGILDNISRQVRPLTATPLL